MKNGAVFGVVIRKTEDGYEASAEGLDLTPVQGDTLKQAVCRIKARVYRFLADREEAEAGDTPQASTIGAIMVALEECVAALRSQDPRHMSFAVSLAEELDIDTMTESPPPLNVLRYEPDSPESAKEKVDDYRQAISAMCEGLSDTSEMN